MDAVPPGWRPALRSREGHGRWLPNRRFTCNAVQRGPLQALGVYKRGTSGRKKARASAQCCMVSTSDLKVTRGAHMEVLLKTPKQSVGQRCMENYSHNTTCKQTQLIKDSEASLRYPCMWSQDTEILLAIFFPNFYGKDRTRPSCWKVKGELK